MLENSVRHYGYTSLDEAETSARRRAEAAGVEVTFNNDGRTTTKVQL
jgi:hypothetical protein